MTLINSYGIGAGRMVSATTDEDDARARQRRQAASQSFEQARRSAVMREQLLKAERTSVLSGMRPTEQPTQQQAQAGAVRREWQASKVAETVEHHPQPEPGVHAGEAASPGSLVSEEAAGPHDDAPARSGAGMATPDDIGVRLTNEPPAVLISRLIDALPGWRAERFPTVMEEHFKTLQQAVAHARQMPAVDSREALEAMDGSLAFVQGYLEASAQPGESRQRLLMIIDGIRQDVTVMMSAAAGPVAGAAAAIPTPVATGTEALRPPPAAAGNRSARINGVAAGKGRSEDSEDTEQAQSSASVVPPCGGVPSGEPLRPAASSLERDINKRRNETPVSVAVKSV